MQNFKSAIVKLEKINERHNAIVQQLSQTETINNQNLYRDLSKELSSIEPVVDGFNRYKKILKQIEDSNELIINEKDEEIKQLAEEEVLNLNIELESIMKKLKELLIPPVQDADKNIIVEIRAGTGGEEAALFSGDLFKMYLKYAERKKWKVEILDSNDTGLGGYKEIIFSITGKNVYDNLRFEYGGHRVQRIPSTESGGRIHTSAVTVAVLPEAEESDVEIKTEDIRIDVYRAGGAGGQHVNKTESAVRITHIPTGLVVQCQDNRSQHQNKASAMKVLRSRLYEFYQGQIDKERAEMRKNQVGSGDRSQKIRTYNFPQNRVTDHRINFTLHKLDFFMAGEMDEMIEALKLYDAEQRMKNND